MFRAPKTCWGERGGVGSWNSNSHGTRPVHLIITMIKLTRTRRLSIRTLSLETYVLESESRAGVQDKVGRASRPNISTQNLVCGQVGKSKAGRDAPTSGRVRVQTAVDLRSSESLNEPSQLRMNTNAYVAGLNLFR